MTLKCGYSIVGRFPSQIHRYLNFLSFQENPIRTRPPHRPLEQLKRKSSCTPPSHAKRTSTISKRHQRQRKKRKTLHPHPLELLKRNPSTSASTVRMAVSSQTLSSSKAVTVVIANPLNINWSTIVYPVAELFVNRKAVVHVSSVDSWCALRSNSGSSSHPRRKETT